MIRTLPALALALGLACGGGPAPLAAADGAVDYTPAEIDAGDRAGFLQAQDGRLDLIRAAVARERGSAPTDLQLELAADPTRWRTAVTVRAADPEVARAWCDAATRALVADRVAEHRRGLEQRRSELGRRLTEATDPAETVSLRRQLVDLAARFDRTDAAVAGSCTLRP